MSHVAVVQFESGEAASRFLLWFRVMANLRESRLAREASGFADALAGNDYANDWLSRAASDIYRTNEKWGEAADRDAAFDGGEWSSAACDSARIKECDRIEEHFFNYAGVTLDHAIRCRISAKTAWRLNL